MKKVKISPEQYSDILSSIELSQIVLNECSVKKYEVKVSGGTIDLNVSMRLSYKQTEDVVIFIPSYKLEGTTKTDENENNKIFTIAASFLLSYIKRKPLDVSDDFVSVFKDNSIELVSWPYFREFIQNTISRMGFPTLTLPSKFFRNE